MLVTLTVQQTSSKVIALRQHNSVVNVGVYVGCREQKQRLILSLQSFAASLLRHRYPLSQPTLPGAPTIVLNNATDEKGPITCPVTPPLPPLPFSSLTFPSPIFQQSLIPRAYRLRRFNCPSGKLRIATLLATIAQ